MKSLSIEYTINGISQLLEFPYTGQKSDTPSIFVFSLNKSGSTLMNKIIADICKESDTVFINIPGACFKQGLPLQTIKKHSFNKFVCQEGICFGGFRLVPPFIDVPNFLKNQYKSVFLIRDPKDALVSNYFSKKFSHPIPQKGIRKKKMIEDRKKIAEISVDEFVLNHAPIVKQRINEYRVFKKNKNFKIYKYEDIIFNKKDWIEDMNSHLGIMGNMNSDFVKKLVTKYDIIPIKENEKKHIRKVTPGDHKSKLKDTTIEKLNNIFQEINNVFGYD